MTRGVIAETLAVHAVGAVRFIDGGSGVIDDDLTAELIDEIPVVTLDEAPLVPKLIIKRGAMAVTFEEAVIINRREQAIRDGVDPTGLNPAPTEAELKAPAMTPLTLDGVVRGSTARWLPARFQVTLERGDIALVKLFRSPAGSPIGGGGALLMTLITAAKVPVPWAEVTLSITVPPMGTVTCRAQTDAHGDVVLAMRRLPPLPKGVADYAATLSVRWLAAAKPTVPVRLSTLVAGKLANDIDGTAMSNLSLRVAPGAVQRFTSFNRDHGYVVVSP